jgi:hypothetical protein
MSEPDALPADRNGNSIPEPVDIVIHVDGPGDTTRRPGRIPISLPVSKEELAKLLHDTTDTTIQDDGPGDTTVRPHPPNVPIFWPENIPRPGKANRPSPQNPA